MYETLKARIDNGETILLDGATGTEIERRGVKMNDHTWSGMAAYTHPDVIRAIHEEYIQIGAEIIITNTFSTARHMLAAIDLADKTREVNLQAAKVAKEARQNAAADHPVYIAGSLSLIAPDIQSSNRPPVPEMKEIFREQAELLAEGGCDFLMLEMMRDVKYTSAAIESCLATGLPVWVGFSIRPSQSGTPVLFSTDDVEMPMDEAFKAAAQYDIDLMGIMHSDFNLTMPGLEILKQYWDGPLSAYPNSGYFEMPNWQFVDIIEPGKFVDEAQQWIDSGVQVVGGCCGIGPEHIRLLKERIFDSQ